VQSVELREGAENRDAGQYREDATRFHVDDATEASDCFGSHIRCRRRACPGDPKFEARREIKRGGGTSPATTGGQVVQADRNSP
jgi:hypothetical protein